MASVDETERISVGDIRCTILRAIDVLTAENTKLKGQNENLQSEMEKLRRENRVLRQELLTMKSEHDDAVRMAANFERELMMCRTDSEAKMETIIEENNRLAELDSRWRRELAESRAALAGAEQSNAAKDEETKTLQRNLEDFRTRLETANRQVANLRARGDAELLEQMELSARQTQNALADNVNLQRVNDQLRADLQTLEALMQESVAELKNEKRRQTLLTSEFNSLLNENNQLKLQLKRKTPAISVDVSRSQEVSPANLLTSLTGAGVQSPSNEHQEVIQLSPPTFASPRTSRHSLPRASPLTRLAPGLVRSSLPPPHLQQRTGSDSGLSMTRQSSDGSTAGTGTGTGSGSGLSTAKTTALTSSSSTPSLPLLAKAASPGGETARKNSRQIANVRTARGVDFTQTTNVEWRAV